MPQTETSEANSSHGKVKDVLIHQWAKSTQQIVPHFVFQLEEQHLPYLIKHYTVSLQKYKIYEPL